MARHDGKVVIVTGGGSGIGREIAVRLASEGAIAWVCDVQSKGGAETVRLVESSGGQGRFHAADVTSARDIRQLVAAVLEDHGRIDGLVNNAAITSLKTILEIEEESWTRVMDVVLKGPFLMTQAVLPHMIAQKSGCIVNVASVSGVMAFGQEAYSAAKAGLINLTKNVAVAYGRDGIRANAICPGAVRTPAWDAVVAADPDVFARVATKYPLGRVGEPADVAEAASYLLSDGASSVTGTTLTVDGGLTAGLMGYTD